MQTKHLHLLLLILLMSGCAPRPIAVRPSYLSDNKDLILETDESSGATLLAFGTRIEAPPGTAPQLRFEVGGATASPWQSQWYSAGDDPIEMPRREVTRSLLALHLADSAAALAQTAVALPDGDGFAFYLEGWSAESVAFVLSAAGDSLLASPPQRADRRTFVFQRGDSLALAVASRQLVGISPRPGGGWSVTLRAARQRAVILAFASTPPEARRLAEKWLRTRADKLEAAARRSLDERLAFRLQSEDDRTNRAFALLSTALVDAARLLRYDSYPGIEQSSQMTAGLWLASRQRPAFVFSPATSLPRRDEQFRWGSAAWRAALAYGMAGDDALEDISRDVLSLLSRLQADYAASGISVTADELPTDSLMREAIACVRLAALFNLGEEIALAHQDNEAQGDLRRRSLDAAREAKRLFAESARRARMLELTARSQPDDELDTVRAEDILQFDDSKTESTYPDTALFLRAGARCGFGWLDNEPESLYNPRLSLGGLVWQRWLAWRFAHDPALTQTGDFDSLCALLLEGPVPGLLTTDPAFAGPPSLEVMAAALQNLAEVFVGIQPNALRNSVTIEPHLSAGWGRTKARVPFGGGTLLLDYNLAESYAVVGMDGRDSPLGVYFGYPLPGGGFLHTDFALKPGKHPMRIALDRDRDDRFRLRVFEVP